MLELPKRIRDGPVRGRTDNAKVYKLPHASNESFKGKALTFISDIAEGTATCIGFLIESGEQLTTRLAQSCCGHSETIRIVEIDSIRVKCMRCNKISKGIRI